VEKNKGRMVVGIVECIFGLGSLGMFAIFGVLAAGLVGLHFGTWWGEPWGTIGRFIDHGGFFVFLIIGIALFIHGLYNFFKSFSSKTIEVH